MSDGLPLAERRHVSAGIIIPVVVSLVAMAAIAGGFVLWSTSNSDTRAVQRQTALVEHSMRTYIASQVASQEAVVIGTAPMLHTAGSLDLDWIDANLGTPFYTTYGYEQTAVLNSEGTPVYLMSSGVSVDPQALGPDLAELSPLVTRLRADIRSGGLRAYLGGARKTLPYAADYVTVAGTPAIATITPIADSHAILPAGTEFLHVAIDYLDDDFASYVGDANLVEDAAFRLVGDTRPDAATLPLINAFGRIVTLLEWRQDWPGKRLLIETVPPLAGVLLAASLLIGVLLRRLWRYSSALEAGRVLAEHQANHDTLTGLPNRAFFEKRLASAATDSARQGQLALFMLDLDRFKQVNDTLGHPAGDELIRAVGGRLRNAISASGSIARLGGDEFAIIEPAISGPGEAMAMAERIVEVLSRPFELFGNEASVGVSIGIGLSADTLTNPAELVRRADIALYEAKANGRNRASVYDPSMDVAVHQRHSVEAELREALRNPDSIQVVFEPVVDAATGETVGAEALPRWVHPHLGEVPRATFIPVAEGTGLIEELGELVLHQACRLGARHPSRIISVNLSLAQIRNPKFFSRVFDILNETGMRPDRLEMEITEDVLLGSPDIAGEVLGKLRATGIRIALDDFGTGYSSLNFLKQYDVDHIKIDRAFARETSDDRSALAMVQAIVGLAHAMHINVTAKGIDTLLQKNRFAGIGCDRLQGTHLSQPLTIERMETAFAACKAPGARSDAA